MSTSVYQNEKVRLNTVMYPLYNLTFKMSKKIIINSSKKNIVSKMNFISLTSRTLILNYVWLYYNMFMASE